MVERVAKFFDDLEVGPGIRVDFFRVENERLSLNVEVGERPQIGDFLVQGRLIPRGIGGQVHIQYPLRGGSMP
jgi:hypothetical protein